MESGMKGREAIRSVLVPLGGDTEEKNYTGRDSPSGVNDEQHTGFPSTGV